MTSNQQSQSDRIPHGNRANGFNPFQRPILLLTSCFGLLSLLSSGMMAQAQERLPEPRIFGDELAPPTPPSSLPTFGSPPSSPLPPPAGREFNYQAPPPPQPSRPLAPTANFYRVDIYGDSPRLLAQVQQIAPDAFVRQGEGVIQAGVFSDPTNARTRVRDLEARGLRARITTVAVGSGAVTDRPSQRFSDRAYFVIIPGESQNLPDIAARIAQLGISQRAVTRRDEPRGAHVAVGPFSGRGEAERWNSYFRSAGFDARIYFGR